MRAGIALGSNLGDRLANLRQARQDIAQLKNVRLPLVSSPAYETDPVRCEEGAPRFLNAVLEVEYGGEAYELLLALEAIERALGRPVVHAQNVSRLIDLDLLYFGQLKLNTAELQLPHPRMMQREFVLRPLSDINAELILPDQTESVGALVRRFPKSEAVVRFAEEW